MAFGYDVGIISAGCPVAIITIIIVVVVVVVVVGFFITDLSGAT